MFHKGIFLNELYRSRKTLLVNSIVLALLMAVFAGFSDMVTREDFVSLLKTYPQSLLEAFNIDPDIMGTFEGWMAGEAYVMYVLILGIVAAMMGSSTVAKEVDQHTSEAVFTLPVSRKAVFLSKAASHLMVITVSALLSTAASLITGFAVAHVAYPGRVALMFAGGYLVSLAFAGVGYAATSFLDSDRTAMSLSIGFVLISFTLNAFSGMSESIRWVANGSLFHLLDVTVIARGDSFPAVGALVSALVYLAGLFGGMLVFSKRDIAA